MSNNIKLDFENRETKEAVRLNKFLSEAGVCSRREADRLIEAGKVYVDGNKAEMGTKVLRGQEVTVNGKPVRREEEMVLLAFNKPVGIVCTAEKREKNNIVDYINYPVRIYPVGRLDKDSNGLILMTNNGDIVNKMMRSGNNHEKEYEVEVNKTITLEFLKGMEQGVYLEELDVTTKRCKIKKIEAKKFRIIITQGYNRQIRRMCEAFGYRVVALKRIRIMNIELGSLKEGTYREVSEEEMDKLSELIKNSSNTTVIKEKNSGNKNSKTKRISRNFK